jgi:hypothetical protein
MSVPTNPPKAAKTTTVANVSTTQRFPVERASTGKPVPQTRPAPTEPPRPAPPLIPKDKQGTAGISKAPSALRNSLEQYAHRQPNGPRGVGARIIRNPGGVNYPSPGGEPPEGIGSGNVPAGGTKVR